MLTEEKPYITIKKKFKKWDGIRYYCEKLYHTGYEFWESKTHPSYSHFMKPKKSKQKTICNILTPII